MRHSLVQPILTCIIDTTSSNTGLWILHVEKEKPFPPEFPLKSLTNGIVCYRCPVGETNSQAQQEDEIDFQFNTVYLLKSQAERDSQRVAFLNKMIMNMS